MPFLQSCSSFKVATWSNYQESTKPIILVIQTTQPNCQNIWKRTWYSQLSQQLPQSHTPQEHVTTLKNKKPFKKLPIKIIQSKLHAQNISSNLKNPESWNPPQINIRKSKQVSHTRPTCCGQLTRIAFHFHPKKKKRSINKVNKEMNTKVARASYFLKMKVAKNKWLQSFIQGSYYKKTYNSGTDSNIFNYSSSKWKHYFKRPLRNYIYIYIYIHR